LNILLATESLVKAPHRLLGVAERVMAGADCFNKGSCLDCETGMELAIEDLSDALQLPLEEGVLEFLVKPWSGLGCSGDLRDFSALCEVGVSITRWGLVFAQIQTPSCLDYNSCANCPRAADAIAGALLELLEDGWEGETGRRLRTGAGLLW